jgi:riboflavin kinase/FMN adenylyltransferase
MMKLVTTLDDLRTACQPGTCVSIGMFDGVHRGHQMLMGKIVEQARTRKLKSLAFTFSNHPLSLLAPPYAPKLLSDPDEKARLLASWGVEICAMLEFTPEFAQIEAHDFLTEIIGQHCRSRYLVCGPDFRFGAQGKGDIEMLRAEAGRLGLEVEVCGALLDSGGAIRSTRVRNALLEGRVTEATRLLGRPYRLHGVVGRGDQRGRTIGYPTANLEVPAARLVPQNGVYAVQVQLKTDGSMATHGAMLNIGIRPTFGLQQRTVEAFIFDFNGDLYGAELTVDFVAKVRDEQKFSSAAELVEQLRIDETTCRTIIGATAGKSGTH